MRKAVSQFKEVIELDAATFVRYGALGIAYQKLGDIPAAIMPLKRVYDWNPEPRMR